MNDASAIDAAVNDTAVDDTAVDARRLIVVGIVEILRRRLLQHLQMRKMMRMLLLLLMLLLLMLRLGLSRRRIGLVDDAGFPGGGVVDVVTVADVAPLLLEFLEAFEETLDDFYRGVDAAVVANQLDDEDAVRPEVALDEPGERKKLLTCCYFC